MFSVTLSISSAIAMSISMIALITPAVSMITLVTSIVASSLLPSIMISVIMAIIFRMTLHHVILRIVTVSNNYLLIPFSSIRSVSYAVHICMQVGPGLIDYNFVTGVNVIGTISRRE